MSRTEQLRAAQKMCADADELRKRLEKLERESGYMVEGHQHRLSVDWPGSIKVKIGKECARLEVYGAHGQVLGNEQLTRLGKLLLCIGAGIDMKNVHIDDVYIDLGSIRIDGDEARLELDSGSKQLPPRGVGDDT